jgi:hypothetical protein
MLNSLLLNRQGINIMAQEEKTSISSYIPIANIFPTLTENLKKLLFVHENLPLLDFDY